MRPGESSEGPSQGCFCAHTLVQRPRLLLLGWRRESQELGARSRSRHFKGGLIKDFFKGTVRPTF